MRIDIPRQIAPKLNLTTFGGALPEPPVSPLNGITTLNVIPTVNVTHINADGKIMKTGQTRLLLVEIRST